MKTLVLFDSNYGNTRLIAEEIVKNISAEVKVENIKGFNILDLKNYDLLITGSPIIGWRPTELMLNTLMKVKDLAGLKFTTFDTRMNVFYHGDAKDKMAKILKKAGANQITDSMAFFVSGKQGPLTDGELQRASDWGLHINNKF